MKNNDWLLAHLGVESSIFHVGKYCGSWQTSAAGFSRASFHIVTEGDCWLHLDKTSSAHRLARGDVLFMLRDIPFILSSGKTRDEASRIGRKEMLPIAHTQDAGTGLICGFFHFSSTMTPIILSVLPSWIILRAQDVESNNVRKIIDLLYEETYNRSHPSESVLSRMAEILLFLALRQYTETTPLPETLYTLKNRPDFLPLLAQIALDPVREWTLSEMAAAMGMSRAHFSKRFTESSGYTPGEALRIMRMSLACQKLQRGESLQRVADDVGYQSLSAFSRAFQRTIGQLPGEYRKQHDRSLHIKD